jgi:type IV pilus assembly protein PilE
MKQPSIRLHEKARVMRGFTLIELMVTVAIVVVLASIAVPSYTAYIVRSNRAVAHSEMMDIANRQQQYLLANRTYADQSQLNYSLPSKLVGKYTVTIAPGAATIPPSPPSFLITFTPVSGSTQARDGALTLNQDGVKQGTW